MEPAMAMELVAMELAFQLELEPHLMAIRMAVIPP